MAEGEALADVIQGLTEGIETIVVVGAGSGKTPKLRRIELDDDTAEEFRALHRKAAGPLIDDETIEYEPGVRPRKGLVARLALEPGSPIADIVAACRNPEELEPLTDDWEGVAWMRFYAAVFANPGEGPKAVFFHRHSPAKELTQSQSGIAIRSPEAPGRETTSPKDSTGYKALADRVFTFGRDFDCVAVADDLYIRNVRAFEYIFEYTEVIRKAVEEALEVINERVPIANIEEFKEAIFESSAMTRKMSEIARRPYLEGLDMDAVKLAIERFGLDIEVVRDGDKEALVFSRGAAERWLIVKLLDDDFLESPMTGEGYVVTRKQGR